MKKGFTLVEVLAVVVILGLLVAIIAPVVNNLLGDSEDVLYDNQVDGIVKATKKYMVEHSELLPEENGVNSISISELINNGAIDKDKVVNPKTKEEMNGCVVVSYNNDFNQYEYNYTSNQEDCIVGTFSFVGHEQVFIVRASGYYKLETWGAQGGAQGGATYHSITGGYGGYSTGIVYINENTKIYINIGGTDQKICEGSPSGTCYGGYNGGGNSHYQNNEKWGAGGGATHIALKTGLLSTLSNENDISKILIVSGGGGGAYAFDSGSAGGYIGVKGYNREGYTQAMGGTQTNGGTGTYAGIFGSGGNCSSSNCSGGGAGFYGGGGVNATSAAGGSSYIGNPLLMNKSMYCYNCEESGDTTTLTVSTTGTSNLKDTTNCPSGYSENPVSKCAKAGNGYARITYLGDKM